jgi:serine/threonine protein kinase
MDLHAIGFLHRSLRPQAFFIGAGVKIRTVYMADFGLPYMFRDPKTNKVRYAIHFLLLKVNRHPRKHTRMMGTLMYMSRNAQKCKEHSRRDDLESWSYLALELFDLEILPWRNDVDSAEVAHKKQKTVDGAFPMIFSKVTLRYKNILRYVSNMKFHERPDYPYIQNVLQEIRVEKEVDFNLPYDWEVQFI